MNILSWMCVSWGFFENFRGKYSKGLVTNCIFLPNTYSVNSLGLSIEALLYALNSLSSVSPIDPCIFGSSAYPQLRAGIKRCIFGILFVSNANNRQTIVAYSWRNVILFSHLLFLTIVDKRKS